MPYADHKCAVNQCSLGNKCSLSKDLAHSHPNEHCGSRVLWFETLGKVCKRKSRWRLTGHSFFIGCRANNIARCLVCVSRCSAIHENLEMAFSIFSKDG